MVFAIYKEPLHLKIRPKTHFLPQNRSLVLRNKYNDQEGVGWLIDYYYFEQQHLVRANMWQMLCCQLEQTNERKQILLLSMILIFKASLLITKPQIV